MTVEHMFFPSYIIPGEPVLIRNMEGCTVTLPFDPRSPRYSILPDNDSCCFSPVLQGWARCG